MSEEVCRHEERVDGLCRRCGHCLHEVILNGACYLCGEEDPEVTIKPIEDVVPISRLKK